MRLAHLCVCLAPALLLARSAAAPNSAADDVRVVQNHCERRFPAAAWHNCIRFVRHRCRLEARRQRPVSAPCKALDSLTAADLRNPPSDASPSDRRLISNGKQNGRVDNNPPAAASTDPVEKADSSMISAINERLNEKAQQHQIRTAADPSQRFAIAQPPRERNELARRQHSELTVNEPDTDNYLFGDVDVTVSQANFIIEQLDNQGGGGGRRRRKVGREPAFRLWQSMPISYHFASNVHSSERKTIRQAIDVWQQNTCVQFREDGPEIDRIEFYDGRGCSSYVGNTGGTQQISIQSPGCAYKGIVAHEIGHALGFFHEQARPDQDAHVSVKLANIPFTRWNNFVASNSRDVRDYGLPYDFGSVMHYDGYGFAINPRHPTIETRDDNHQSTIGQRRLPSFIDFAQVNAAYCADRCSAGASVVCTHGGYPHPNDCSRCLCPSGFGGADCSDVAFNDCGRRLRAYRQPSYISSPNYPAPFERGAECAWLLTAEPGSKVFMQFEGVFDFDCKDTCDESYVEVKDGKDFRRTGYRFCCGILPTKTFTSSDDEMVVLMRGDGPTSAGFRAKVWSDGGPNKPPGSLTPKPPPPSLTTTTRRSTISIPWKTPPPKTRPSPVTTVTPWPLPATTNKAGCSCDSWTAWSGACTQECGGCGSRRRTRRCNKADCFDTDERKCNMDACAKDRRFIYENAELHLLFDGCCIGLLRNANGQCGGLESAFGQWSELFRSFLPGSDTFQLPIPL